MKLQTYRWGPANIVVFSDPCRWRTNESVGSQGRFDNFSPLRSRPITDENVEVESGVQLIVA